MNIGVLEPTKTARWFSFSLMCKLSGVDCSMRASKMAAVGCSFFPFASRATRRADHKSCLQRLPRRSSVGFVDRRRARRKVVRQQTPRRAGACKRTECIENFAPRIIALGSIFTHTCTAPNAVRCKCQCQIGSSECHSSSLTSLGYGALVIARVHHVKVHNRL